MDFTVTLSSFCAGLCLGNAHAIVPMTIAASVGKHLLSTPVELGLTAAPQARSDAGATEERRLEGVGSRPTMLGPTTPRPVGHPWPPPSRLAHPSRTRRLPRPPCPREALARRPRRWLGPRATGRRSPLRPVPWSTARTWDIGMPPPVVLNSQDILCPACPFHLPGAQRVGCSLPRTRHAGLIYIVREIGLRRHADRELVLNNELYHGSSVRMRFRRGILPVVPDHARLRIEALELIIECRQSCTLAIECDRTRRRYGDFRNRLG